MIHLFIPLVAIALIAALLGLIDWLRIREERRRRSLWRQRIPRSHSSHAPDHPHDPRYP